jgi:hypothetical protein
MRHHALYPRSERTMVTKRIPERTPGVPVRYAVSGVRSPCSVIFVMILAQ